MKIVRMTDEMWRTMLEAQLRQRSISERQMNDAEALEAIKTECEDVE